MPGPPCGNAGHGNRKQSSVKERDVGTNIKFVTTTDLIHYHDGRMIRVGAVGIFDVDKQLIQFRQCDILTSNGNAPFDAQEILRNNQDRLRLEEGL
jgi:hypothetical protein